jgi:flavin reductase (DIM6/NTAB) family NADH-FMN oxidoreductase RutF
MSARTPCTRTPWPIRRHNTIQEHTMSDDIHFYEPSKGHGLPHDPFNAIVGPRPIGWISSQDAGGKLNLAPYSFFNAFNYVPPIIGFCSIGRKDSLNNIEQTGEFVWNLATRSLAEQMNMSCAAVPADVSEFELAGLTAEPSRIVSVPRVKETPVSFECKVTQIIQLQRADKEVVPSWLILGEVVAVHIAKRLLKEGVYDTAAGEPILRGGGPADYFQLSAESLFKMYRPKV